MTKIFLLITSFTALFLSACQPFKYKGDQHFDQNISTLWNEYLTKDFDQSSNLEVLVATNRQMKGGKFSCSKQAFSNNYDKKVYFGLCSVTVSKNRAVGSIDNENPSKAFEVTNSKALEIAALTEILKKSQRTPLVFVHGFNVDFEEALLRASQIAYDLKYQGPIVLFTWPAGAAAQNGIFEQFQLNKTYQENQDSARDSVILFKNFIAEMQKNQIRINLLVHSMGHQVVLPALAKLSDEVFKDAAKDDVKNQFINKLVLNAPDFEVNNFRNILPKINKISRNVTLYCSLNDKAMVASKTFNKNERLGACANISGNVDVINVSAIDDSALGLGHGYYASREILTDLFQNLLGIEAKKRLFVKKAEVNGKEKFFLRK